MTINSLWGIKINSKNKDQHAKFVSLRNFKKKDYENFWNLLKGNILQKKKKSQT